MFRLPLLTDPDGRDTIIVSGPGRSDPPFHQSPGWYGAAANALGQQLVNKGMSPDRVHVVSSQGAAAAVAAKVARAGRKVSGVVFAGHGAENGNFMTESNPDNFADTSPSTLAHTAKVAKGGVAVSLACDTATGDAGDATANSLKGEGIGFAGWDTRVHLDNEGGFDNGGPQIPIGSARPPEVTAPAEKGATVADILLNAEKRVNGGLGTPAPAKANQRPASRHHRK